jgi:hypothetical protein
MRKFALILLMCLLPLQVAWAGVADFCEHEEDQAAQHFGHHQAEHPFAQDADDDGNGKPDPLHDHCCHLSGFIGALNTHVIAALPAMRTAMPFAHSSYPSLLPDKPERPKWTALA